MSHVFYYLFYINFIETVNKLEGDVSEVVALDLPVSLVFSLESDKNVVLIFCGVQCLSFQYTPVSSAEF